MTENTATRDQITEQSRAIYELASVAGRLKTEVEQIAETAEAMAEAQKTGDWWTVSRHSESLASANARVSLLTGEARVREAMAVALGVAQTFVNRAKLGEDCATEWYRSQKDA